MVVTVYQDRCDGVEACPRNGVCMEVCALDAIEHKGDSIIITEDCTNCGLCVMNCPRVHCQSRKINFNYLYFLFFKI